MADSTGSDISKMRVVDLRKELKTRGLSYAGDKAELITRLQAAMNHEEQGDINLDSDEIDSDGVLDDEDDKSQTDILDETAVDTISEELALADQPSVKCDSDTKLQRTLKRKISTLANTEADTEIKSGNNKESGTKKIVLHRSISNVSLTSNISKSVAEVQNNVDVIESNNDSGSESHKIKITSEIDPKKRLEMRAKRFGLPTKMSDEERKEARKKRFGNNSATNISLSSPVSLSDNIEKLKQRAERFGQSVSKIMTDIEDKEKLEKRKAKFGTIK